MFFKRADCLTDWQVQQTSAQTRDNFERQDSGEVYNGLADYI